MDAIERIARALCRAAGGDPDQTANGIVVTDMGAYGFAASATGPLEPLWHSYRGSARAAIEAMREPTDAMVSTVVRDVYPGDQGFSEFEAESVWQRMIDAALTPSPASK